MAVHGGGNEMLRLNGKPLRNIPVKVFKDIVVFLPIPLAPHELIQVGC